MQRYTVYIIWKLLYMFRVVPLPIIRSANNYIYSIWYLSHRYCYLPLSWKCWNWFECAVGGAHHLISQPKAKIYASLYFSIIYTPENYLVHGNIIDNFNPLNPELNPICYLLALLGAHHFLHVSRIRVKLLTFRLLMSYIYMEHPFLMFLDHTQRRSTVGRTPLDE